MSLERLFKAVEGLPQRASVDAAFGEPKEVEGRVLIPVACVKTGFGICFAHGMPGQDEQPAEVAEGAGSGSAGGAMSRPMAVIEVTPEETVIRPILDEGRIALAGVALLGWTVFWLMATLRAIFGSES